MADADIDDWAYYDITEAANSHNYTETSDGEIWTGRSLDHCRNENI